jgi:Aerotolerance regulator N-terminal
VTFAAAGALAGLVLLLPLVLLHLRQRGQVVREVPSLLLWEELDLPDAPQARRLQKPPLPLLLLLQALAVLVLVLALAEPTSAGSPSRPTQVVVLDDSWRMEAPGRLAEARQDIARVIAADPPSTPIRIVLAGAVARVLYRGNRAGAGPALAHVVASAAPSDLAAALTVAGGLLEGAGGSVWLVRAPEDPVPAVSARTGKLRTLTLGPSLGQQGIFDTGARCGFGATAACEVYATVSNTTDHPVDDRISATAAGHPPLALRVPVAADSSTPLTLASSPGQQVSLRLQSGYALPAEQEAWTAVPAAGGLPQSTNVTLVGTPSVALATAQAFAAVPGVALQLRTPASFRRSEANQSSLLVLDDWTPRGALPPSPAVLLVDPPQLPDGHVGGALAETTASGTDAGSELLAGVEISSLSIDPGAARQLDPPPWLTPVIWSPDGVLLAAGDDGSQRVAALSFEPGQSDLPQLAAFPILAANVVRWAAGWAPATASAGVPIVVDAPAGVRSVTLERAGRIVQRASSTRAPVVLDAEQPGLYSIQERGPGVARSAIVAVDTAAEVPSSAEVVGLGAAIPASSSVPRVSEAFWFLLAALLLLGLEWAYWISRGPRAGLWAR